MTAERIEFWLQEYALQLRQNPKSAKAAEMVARHFIEDAGADPDELPALHDLLVDAALLIQDTNRKQQ